MNTKKEYICIICTKFYASHSSLCNHNKKFHNIINCELVKDKYEIKSLTCNFCNKIFKYRASKSKHNKICKNKYKIDKIDELEKKIQKLETIITKTKITKNTTTIINNNINNIKVSFGNEDISKLSVSDKKLILNSGFNSLIKLIEVMHLNKKYPEYNNIKITNINSKYGKIYDETTQIYTTEKKKDIIENLISTRTLDLKEIHNEYNKNSSLHGYVLKLIEKINTYTPEDDNLKEFHKNLCDDIALLIYNKTKLF